MTRSEGAEGLVSRARYEREKAARKRAEALLDEKSRALFEAERAKSQFLSVISHEFRTPLNGLLGATEALAPHVAGPEAAAQVSTIEQSGRAILSLVDALLDLANLEARRVQLRKDTFSLAQVLGDVKGSVAAAAEEKGLGLSLDYGAQMCGRRYLGDASRLRNILGAILGNAVKFTESGEVRLAAAPAAGGEIVITIDDTGPGVDMDDRTRIFEPFVQGEAFSARMHTGAGLGLSLARDLLHLMGGRIAVADSPLGGARFIVTLSLPLAEEARPRVRSSCGVKGRRVLIVDDNPVNRLVARTAVSAAGMDWAEAENGRQALEALARDVFDVVLMDIQMPVMTGDEAIRHIRASADSYRDVPIIVLTAHGLPEGPSSYEAIGATKCLEKPVGLERLRREIDRVTLSSAA